jgi:hypothetical protein
MDVGINIINLINSPEKYTTLTLKKKLIVLMKTICILVIFSIFFLFGP